MSKPFSFFIFIFFFSSLTAQSNIFNIYISQDANAGYVQLNWDEPLTLEHSIKRKSINDADWTIIEESFTGSQYIDSTTVVGQAYEYKVTHFDKTNSSTYKYTFAYAGFEIPRVDDRGRLLVLVDNLYESALQDKIDRLILDLEGDGWSVIQESVSQSTEPIDVKVLIREKYDQPDGLAAVFLLGHIPVPYSGNIWPDGHIDHLGAWPADVYYGEMNETWTINQFEEDFSKSKIQNAEVQIGRVDFYDMPAFAETELELLKAYLDKNHAFRQRHFAPNMQATYKDNFNSGYDYVAKTNFPILVGAENSNQGNYRNDLLADSYIWSYGAGSGTYTSAGGISNTSTMANDSLQGVFTMLFGSYFGDWDNLNNYLRSVLGSGTMLTTCWGNRPRWVLFHMGLGTNIGFQTKLSQADLIYNTNFAIVGAIGNQDTLEVSSHWARSIHVALLGDPSLRMHMMQSITNLLATENNDGVNLSWEYEIPSDSFAGFNIFKKGEGENDFEYVASVPSNVTSFLDESSNDLGQVKYMVRPERLEVTPSGSFYNQATGVQVGLEVTIIDQDNDGFTNVEDCDDNNPNVNPNQTEIAYNGIDDDCDEMTFDDDLDQDGFLLADDCDETNPNINPDAEEILDNGIDEDCDGEDMISSVHNFAESTIKIYPNPVQNFIKIDMLGNLSLQAKFFNIKGKLLMTINNPSFINVENIESGLYILQIEDTKSNKRIVEQIIISR